MTIERRHKGPRMSQIVVHNNTVYLAGIVGNDRDADIATSNQSGSGQDRRLSRGSGHQQVETSMRRDMDQRHGAVR